jgi:hypothetical protein
VKADLRPRVAERASEARARAAELAAFIDVLHRTLERLDELPDRTGPCDAECGFPAAGPTVPPAAEASPPAHGAARGEAAGGGSERWRTAPVACSLRGDALGERAAQWRRLVGDAVGRRVEDGVRLTVPADRATAVMALAADEQRCCPFFDFRLHLDGPVLHLEVRAPAEGAGLLAELFGTVS